MTLLEIIRFHVLVITSQDAVIKLVKTTPERRIYEFFHSHIHWQNRKTVGVLLNSIDLKRNTIIRVKWFT